MGRAGAEAMRMFSPFLFCSTAPSSFILPLSFQLYDWNPAQINKSITIKFLTFILDFSMDNIRSYCDLPLQRKSNNQSVRNNEGSKGLKKTFAHISCHPNSYKGENIPPAEQENTVEQDEEMKNQFFEYDLPCKRNDFIEYEPETTAIQQTEENRPMLIKNVFFQTEENATEVENGDYDLELKSYTKSNKKPFQSTSKLSQEKARKKVETIYEKLIAEAGNWREIQNISSLATFKPRDLKQQLQSYRRWEQKREVRSKSELIKNAQSEYLTCSQINQVKKILCSKRLERHQSETKYKKASNFQSNQIQSKTKYEKILQQHFSGKKKNCEQQKKISHRIMGKQQICFENKRMGTPINSGYHQRSVSQMNKASYSMQKSNVSAEKHEAISSKRNEMHTEKFESKNSKNGVKARIIERLFNKNIAPKEVSKKLIESQQLENTNQKRENNQEKKEKLSEKLIHSRSDRWMQMNFHERQRRVIESRQQKEEEGKKQKIQKEIKPCTFKPSLMIKDENIERRAPTERERQSYLQNYYTKISKKY